MKAAPGPTTGRAQRYGATLALGVDDTDALSDATQRALGIVRDPRGLRRLRAVRDRHRGVLAHAARPVRARADAVARLSTLGTILAQDVQIQDLQEPLDGIDRRLRRVRPSSPPSPSSSGRPRPRPSARASPRAARSSARSCSSSARAGPRRRPRPAPRRSSSSSAPRRAPPSRCPRRGSTGRSTGRSTSSPGRPSSCSRSRSPPRPSPCGRRLGDAPDDEPARGRAAPRPEA